MPMVNSIRWKCWLWSHPDTSGLRDLSFLRLSFFYEFKSATNLGWEAVLSTWQWSGGVYDLSLYGCCHPSLKKLRMIRSTELLVRSSEIELAWNRLSVFMNFFLASLSCLNLQSHLLNYIRQLLILNTHSVFRWVLNMEGERWSLWFLGYVMISRYFT